MNTQIKKIFTPQTNNFLKTSFGNILEWYDFTIYGMFAISIAKAFFTTESKFVGLLLVFATFAIGFLARPVGSVIFGFIGDKFGKFYAVNLSIWCMAIPTALIGFLPTYAEIGIAAPLLLITLRICQGLSAGGQFSGLIAIAAETNPKNKNLLVSSVYAISVIGCFGASLVGWASVMISNAFHPVEDITKSLVWRIPFMLSFVFFLIYIKLNPEFTKEHTNDEDGEKYSIKTIFTKMPKQMMLMIALSAGQTAIYYLIFTYLVTYFQLHLHINKDTAFLIINILFFASILLFPLFGFMADQKGNRVNTVKSTSLFFVLGIIVFSCGIIFNKIFGVIGAAIMAIAFCAIISYTTSFFAEIFPSKYRMTACSLSFNLGVTISGFAPMLAEIFLNISKYGLSIFLAVNVLLVLISVIGIAKYIKE